MPRTTAQRPAVIERVDAQTISFTGPIQEGDDARFEALLTPETRRLIISSGGGEVTAGMKMGKLIHQHGLDVEVRDVCGSACANYIFTAGRKKIVPKGSFVGFHGDPKNSPLIQVWRFFYRNNAATAQYTKESNRLTEELYALIGINPKLYAHSAQFTLANNVTFWVPSPRELDCMNVKGLEMWFSDNLADFTNSWKVNVRTSKQDIRQPSPDICAP